MLAAAPEPYEVCAQGEATWIDGSTGTSPLTCSPTGA